MAVLSFDDYSGDKKPVNENKKVKRSDKRKQKKIQEKVETSTPAFNFRKLKNTPKLKQEEVNENAFQVGDTYKVKIVVDVPVSLVKQYSEKVSQDTGKDALENFSESELAEQMVDYIVKQNLNIDSVPNSVAVGEEAIEQDVTQPEEVQADAEQVEDETSTEETTKETTEEDPDGLLNMTDDDITFGDDEENVEVEEETSDEEGEKAEDGSDMEFEAEESDLGEEIEVEEEEKSEEDSKEEEETLDGMFQNVMKRK